MVYSQIDYTKNPPTVDIPKHYNACTDFIERNLSAARAENLAVIDENGRYTYAELARRVNQAGNALQALGAGMETRIMICLPDTIDFPSVFWGAIKIGAVPVPVNTLLTSEDYDFMIRDSRAPILIVSQELYDKFAGIISAQPFLQHVIISGQKTGDHPSLHSLLSAAGDTLATAPTCADDVAFWLYTSGSTGAPKGAMHLHSDLIYTAAYYGTGILNIQPGDIVFSAAKLFFAYGLGNGMTFPFHVGACAVYLAGRPTPDAVMAMLADHKATIFFGVPTLYAAMLADSANDGGETLDHLRLCISAGEPLPKETALRWQKRFGQAILDGIGSTELLHIFLSNRIDDMRYGTTGKAVPGYELRIVDEDDVPVVAGEIGELLVRGPTAAMAYWNRRECSRNTFLGPWTRTGDKYILDEGGYYQYCGRTDDMMKVSGQWVSPFDVESALIAHEKVLEAAVVAKEDENKLIKPKAYVLLKDPADASDALADELKTFVKSRLAPFKYPRWIEFTQTLPKTATGKIQRFKLR